MEYIEAPEYKFSKNKKSIFLAGSITDCPDWQKDVIEELKDLDIIIFNPRRKNFPIKNPNAAFQQIKWEHDMLRKADIIPFWFSKETLGPIVLYELGAHSMTNKPITIGMNNGYERKNDVIVQTSLVRPDIKITSDFKVFIKNIKSLIK